MSKEKKVIALTDTRWSGHHETYLKFFTKTLLELGYEVIVLCPAPTELLEWVAINCHERQEHCYGFELQEPQPIPSLSGGLQTAAMKILRWQQLAKSLDRISVELNKSIDLTFIALLDTYIGTFIGYQVIDRIFPRPWSGLYFHPYFLRTKLVLESFRFGWLDPLSSLRSKNCPAIALLDEGVIQKMEHKINKPIVTFPDFTDNSSPDMDDNFVRKIKLKSDGRRVIGLVGSLGKGKGFLTLLRASQRINHTYLFVFAGQLSENSFDKNEILEIQSIIDRDPSNCLFNLTRIPSETQYNAIINSCDFLYVAYENFLHSSNTLTKAALFDKPVISGNIYCIGERVKNFNLGYRIEPGNIRQCVNLLESLAKEPLMEDLFINPDFETYRKLHSIERLKNSFQEILNFF